MPQNESDLAAVLAAVSLPEGKQYTTDDLHAFVQVGALSANIAHKMRNVLERVPKKHQRW